MEYKGVAQYHEDWDMESQFLTSDLHSVMNLGMISHKKSLIKIQNCWFVHEIKNWK